MLFNKGVEKLLNYAFQFVLFVIGVYTRCFGLNYPNSPVFDEVYYGSLCSFYVRKKFHIDQQPPLFRMLVCSILPSDYQRKELWAHIGKEFPDEINGVRVRIMPALLGVVLILLIYQLFMKLGFSIYTAFIAGLIISLENGIIVQSRLMLSDSMHLLLLVFIFFLLTFQSILPIFMSHLTMGALISVNQNSSVIWFLVVFISLQFAWVIAINRQNTLVKSLCNALFVSVSSILSPLLVLIIVHMVNMTMLSNNGPHGIMLSSNFQTSLERGLCSTESHIRYGATIRLKANDIDNPYDSCYLQSYPSAYPLFYSDKRGSTGEQLVSCANKKHRFSRWEVVHVEGKKGNIVKDGDIVRLQHQFTKNFLKTDNVSAPVSMYDLEVSCSKMKSNSSSYFDWSVNIIQSNMFDITNHSWGNLGRSYVQFEHVVTGKLLQTSGQTLPEWGKGEREVIGDVISDVTCEDDARVVWNAEDSNCDDEKREGLIGTFAKALEYIKFTHTIPRNNAYEHRFGSKVYGWFLAQTSITYWHNLTTHSHMLFVGNVVSWTGGLLSVLITGVHAVVTLLFVQRGIKIPDACHQLNWIFYLMVTAWFLQVFRHLISTHQYSFSYHYLSAVICLHVLQSALLGTVFEHCGIIGKTATFIYLGLVVYCYWTMRSITYGYAHKNKQELINNSWWGTWEILGS